MTQFSVVSPYSFVPQYGCYEAEAETQRSQDTRSGAIRIVA